MIYVRLDDLTGVKKKMVLLSHMTYCWFLDMDGRNGVNYCRHFVSCGRGQ